MKVDCRLLWVIGKKLKKNGRFSLFLQPQKKIYDPARRTISGEIISGKNRDGLLIPGGGRVPELIYWYNGVPASRDGPRVDAIAGYCPNRLSSISRLWGRRL